MVVGAFPIAKLGALFLKQLSKPIANYAKHRAKSHPFFRKYICMPPAQIYNWCEIQAKMWFLNLGKPVNIPPLNEAMAIELGANLLGEGILFIIAAGILIFEYRRQSAKQTAAEAKLEADFQSLRDLITELQIEQEQNRRRLDDLQSRSLIKLPWKGNEDSRDASVKPKQAVNRGNLVNLALAYIEDTFYHEEDKTKCSLPVTNSLYRHPIYIL